MPPGSMPDDVTSPGVAAVHAESPTDGDAVFSIDEIEDLFGEPHVPHGRRRTRRRSQRSRSELLSASALAPGGT